MLQLLSDIMPVINFCFFLLILFIIGLFAYRLSQSVDKSLIKSMGDFLYRVVCKSGFIVILIVIITYFICKVENDKRNEIINSENTVKHQLVNEV